MLYWILGGIGVAASGLLALFFRRKKILNQTQQGISNKQAQAQKQIVADKAIQVRAGVVQQVSEDLKKIRDKFGGK